MGNRELLRQSTAAEHPIVRLAAVAEASTNTMNRADRPRVALLVSFVYLYRFKKYRRNLKLHYRDWVMDSGAYSADNSGKEIKLAEYIMLCRQLLAEDPTLTEVFSLDVIKDWKESAANTRKMW